jgi:hypothetical protein
MSKNPTMTLKSIAPSEMPKVVNQPLMNWYR